MSAIEQTSIASAPDLDTPPRRRIGRLRIVRWIAVAVWAAVVAYRTVTDGLAFNRELLLG